MKETEIDKEKVLHLIEIRGIYDGWSVARMKDGRLLNRWEKSDYRYAPTQEWIARAQALETKGKAK